MDMDMDMDMDMNKFQHKYRIPPARAQWWDYANAGAYFITICTANREHFFGEIEKMNELGRLAEKYWYEIPNQFNFIELGAFVVMPNHIHGILIITVETRLIASVQSINRISTPSSKMQGGVTGLKNPMLHNNISRVVRWYKGRCTFEIRKIHADFAWQSLFHDHIIKNEESYQKIGDYLVTQQHFVETTSTDFDREFRNGK